MDNVAHPNACSLDDAARADRIRAWQRIAKNATSRRVEHGSYVATYPNDAQLLRRLRELIAAEAACCSFLQIRLDETPKSIVTELRLPADASDAMHVQVAAMFGPCVSLAARRV
jgi:hypothetical protein